MVKDDVRQPMRYVACLPTWRMLRVIDHDHPLADSTSHGLTTLRDRDAEAARRFRASFLKRRAAASERISEMLALSNNWQQRAPAFVCDDG